MASEGKEVRVAHDGPDIDHDTLIGRAEEFNREDSQRASSAGETRQKIGNLLETTALNGKAFSWLRQIMKVNDKANGQEKAMDIIRSLEMALPMVRDHVAGQGTGSLPLENPNADEAPQEEGEPEGTSDDAPEDAETAEFNNEVDDAMGEDDAVTPYDPAADGETAIDFGGEDDAA